MITQDLVSHTFFMSISHFRLFLSDFEGVFLFYIWREGVIENEVPRQFIYNIEGQVVSYASQVEKAISSYLRVILRVVFIFGS